MLLHLILGTTAFVDLDPQTAVGLGQFGRALLDPPFQLVVRPPKLLLGLGQTLGLPHPFQSPIDRRRATTA